MSFVMQFLLISKFVTFKKFWRGIMYALPHFSTTCDPRPAVQFRVINKWL